MNNIDKQYQQLLKDIIDNGVEKKIEPEQEPFQYSADKFVIK